MMTGPSTLKKIIFLAILCGFGFTSSSFAVVQLGAKLGVASTSISITGPYGDPGYGSKYCGLLGTTAEWAVPHSNLAVRGELLFVQKEADGSSNIPEASKTSNAYEIDLPVFLVYYVNVSRVSPFMEFGPEFGVNVWDKYTYSDGGVAEDAHLKKTNFSLNFGGGFMAATGIGNFSVDLRYNLGLVNIHENDPSPYRYIDTIKTHGIQLLLGYNFLKI